MLIRGWSFRPLFPVSYRPRSAVQEHRNRDLRYEPFREARRQGLTNILFEVKDVTDLGTVWGRELDTEQRGWEQ